jgi:hypothetical protein
LWHDSFFFLKFLLWHYSFYFETSVLALQFIFLKFSIHND